MGILSWILMGLIAGAVAKFILPGRAPSGWLWTIGLGIVGALVGGFIGHSFGWGDIDGFDVRSLALAIGGAVLCIFIYDQVRRR